MVIVVGVADMKASSSPEDRLVTHALGSCLGIAIYDPVARVGGLLHAMLPDSGIDPRKGERSPFMFIDTGVPRLFRECYRLGAEKGRLEVRVAGGAASRSAAGDPFRIGERNLAALESLLRRNGVPLLARDVGGARSRTMSLDLGTGEVWLKVDGRARPL